MHKVLKNIGYLFVCSIMFYSCSEECATCPAADSSSDDSMMSDPPSTYEFLDADGASTVSYSGQVVRNLIIQDIKAQVTANASILTSMYGNDETNQARTIFTQTTPTSSQTTYGDISTKSVSGKVAADASCEVSDCTVYGYGDDPATLLPAWFAAAASGQYTTDGLDIPQMVQKLLMGAVSYYQGTTHYLGSIGSDDNTAIVEGENYTEMAHHWDESFGYFGAAANYASYTDSELAGGTTYKDSNENSAIDFLSEYCTGISINAGKRDSGADATDGVDFTGTMFDAYIMGRHLIANGGTVSDIEGQRDIIVNTWEKLFAANTIHYINDTIGDIDGAWAGTETASCTADTELCQDYSKHFSEMRAFAMALNFNSMKTIPSGVLTKVYDYLGTAPVFPGSGDVTAYRANLLLARDLLQSAYSFPDATVAGW